MTELIKYSRIGEEDLAVSTGISDTTFTVTLPDGRQVTLTKITVGSFGPAVDPDTVEYRDTNNQLIHAWGTKG